MPEEEKQSTAEAPIPPIEEYNEKVMCDFGHKFHANSTLLIPFRNATSASLGEMMFADNEHKVRMSLDSSPDTGFLLACPICKVVHMEGFSLIDLKEEALETDQTVPERNIQPGL